MAVIFSFNSFDYDWGSANNRVPILIRVRVCGLTKQRFMAF